MEHVGTSHIDLYFDKATGVLHIYPVDGLGRMALKYHDGEVQEHGLDQMVEIHTEILGKVDPPEKGNPSGKY